METPSHERLNPLTPAQPVGANPFGSLRVVTRTVVGLFSVMRPFGLIVARLTRSPTFVPGANECTTPMSAHDERTGVALMPTISSPTLMPAVRAGEGATTPVTTAPVATLGIFQPSARNAATSAACLESYISW